MRNTKNCEDSLYLKNPLPADVQIKLVKLAQSGSKEAQDELVETNMRFVRMIVARYSRSDEYEVMDLVNEGVSGLIKAIYKFEFHRDVTFMSYAVWWIKQAISSYVRSKSRLIRQPDNRQEDMGFTFSSIDSQLTSDESGRSTTFGDTIEQTTFNDPDEIIGSNEISRHIETLLNEIPQDEAMILKFRFGIDGEIMDYSEISKLTKINTGRLKHMLERGLRRVRKNITFSPNREDLLQYLQTE